MRLLLAALCAALLSACAFDAAALVEPDAEQIVADVGDLRVLSYDDDPTAGDDWIDVLSTDGDVVEESTTFREADSRVAEDDQAAEIRRLMNAVGPGRTVLVELNCRDCTDGVPTGLADLHVWDFVVDEDETLRLGPQAARPDEVTTIERGALIVVVHTPEQAGPVDDAEPGVLTLVGTHTPDGGAPLFVDVYAGVDAGATTLSYLGADGAVQRYEIVVT